jgi:diguanylate cyclase (GGDEF)-like protein
VSATDASNAGNEERRRPTTSEVISGRTTPIPRRTPLPGSRRRIAPAEEKKILDERGELAQDLIEIAARDTDRTQEDEEALAEARKSKPDTFYSDLIYTLAHIRYPEVEARLVWVNLLTHKAEMSSLLGRNVGVRVAALDFFRNKVGSLQEVTIMDSSEYIHTAKLVITDGLTGAYNHRYFQDRLQREIERASREQAPVSLLMIDIDYFKKYNDKNGHMAGDVALREVSSAVRGTLQEQDVFARYGGEEFAVILPGYAKAEAMRAAEKMRAAIESQTTVDAKSQPGGKLTISLGVATYPSDASDRNGLIDWADLSLYLAKTGGRNRIASCPVDRRRAERSSADLKAQMWFSSEPQGEPHQVHVVDIGFGGMALVSETLPPTGSRVILELTADGLANPIEVKGRIAWKRPENRLGNLAGVEFVGLTAEMRSRLRGWVSGSEEA